MRFSFSYGRIIKQTLKKAFNKRMLPLWIAIAGIVAVFVLISSLGRTPAAAGPEDTAFWQYKKIVVGMVTDIEGMSFEDESGEITGYNRELMDKLLEELYPGKKIEYVSVQSQQASYALKTGEIDLAMGEFASGVTKTLGLALSAPYAADTVYAYTAPSSSADTLSGLIGRRVYATTTEFTAKSLNAALKEKKLDITYISAASYPDMMESMDAGKADAVIAMERLAGDIEKKYSRIDDPIMKVDCRIIAWTDRTDVISVINARLNKYAEEGVLKELREKWGVD